MKWLVVGAGSIGRKHLATLHALGEYDLAVVDPDPAARKAAEQWCGRKGVHPSWDDAPSGGVAVICTPTAQHADDILTAYGQGRHVICEKPIHHTLDRADAVLSAQGSRLGMVACPMRFHVGWRELKRHVTEQTLGPIFYARAWYRQHLAEWRPGRDPLQTYSAQRSQGGGLFFDRIHEIDYLRWLFGEPDKVRGSLSDTGTFDMDVEDIAFGLCGHQGVVAAIELDCITPGYHCGVQLVGPGGQTVCEYAPVVDGVVQWQGHDEATRFQAEHWRAVLSGMEEPQQTLADGYRAVQTAVGLYASAEQGVWATLTNGPVAP